MTPKEKADDLFLSYFERLPDYLYDTFEATREAKQCALIAVDEILEVLELIDTPTAVALCYWYHEVKQEIANL